MALSIKWVNGGSATTIVGSGDITCSLTGSSSANDGIVVMIPFVLALTVSSVTDNQSNVYVSIASVYANSVGCKAY